MPEDQPHGLYLSERDARATERNYDVPTLDHALLYQDLMPTSAANWRHFAPAQEAPIGHTTTGFESDVATAAPTMSVTALAGQHDSVHSTMSGIGLSTFDRLFSDRFLRSESALPVQLAGTASAASGSRTTVPGVPPLPRFDACLQSIGRCVTWFISRFYNSVVSTPYSRGGTSLPNLRRE
jgi:hypothetical protein